jgi:hypothetical protein
MASFSAAAWPHVGECGGSISLSLALGPGANGHLVDPAKQAEVTGSPRAAIVGRS